MILRSSVAALVVVMLAPGLASAELPDPCQLPGSTDDYRIAYSISAGIWSGSDQTTLHHRVGLQLPLWRAAAGAVLPFGNLLGDVNDSTLGNLRMYLQWLHTMRVANRANLTIGGGIDAYAPTATPVSPQDPEAELLASQSPGESALFAPGVSFAMRPRLHVSVEMWIFSLQLVAGTAVHFEGREVRVALEWGATGGIAVLPWMALLVETTGINWLHPSPEWMDDRIVMLGGGIRFKLGGWRPAVWFHAPASGDSEGFGRSYFISLELMWQHGRQWILF